ncbi:MAG: HK97-gp10 family putative phage morphogenesis protein [Shewanella sp.]
MGIKGAQTHLKKLQRLSGPAMTREAGKLVFSLADMHATDAALSITKGAVSGAQHVASSPGQAPNADTHLLDRSIEATKTGPLTAESSANAPYAAALEKGTSKMAARPFMGPAAKRVRPKADKLAKAAINRIISGGSL